MKGNLYIELDPDVHQAFLESSAVSRKYLLEKITLTDFFYMQSTKDHLLTCSKSGLRGDAHRPR